MATIFSRQIIGVDKRSGAELYVDVVIEDNGEGYEIHGATTNEQTIAYYTAQRQRLSLLFQRINSELGYLFGKHTHYTRNGWVGMHYDRHRDTLNRRYDALHRYAATLDRTFQVEASLFAATDGGERA